jgi:hypothetical protein
VQIPSCWIIFFGAINFIDNGKIGSSRLTRLGTGKFRDRLCLTPWPTCVADLSGIRVDA